MATKQTKQENVNELFEGYFNRVKCTPPTGAIVTHMAPVNTKAGLSVALWLADDDGIEISFVMPSPQNFELNRNDWLDKDGNLVKPEVGMRLVGGWAFDKAKDRETFSLRPVL